MLLWLLAGTGWAQDICPSCPYATIGAAVDSVLTGQDVAFVVANGNYFEPDTVVVAFDRRITLTGLGAVTVTNNAEGPTFLVSGGGAELVIEGIAITAINDRAIEVVADGLADLRNTVLYTIGLQPEGGALLVDHGTLLATDAVFLDNIATSGGGHLVARDAFVDLESCLFRGGFARRGGAILLESTSLVPTDVTITSSTFEDNLAAESGGAIEVGGNVLLTIVDSTFERNAADSGGVIADHDANDDGAPQVNIGASTFSDNTAQGSGGAIRSVAGRYLVVDSTLRDNSAPDGGAAAVTGGSLSLERNVLCRNEATNGGAVFTRTTEAQTWFNNRLIENTADVTGGAIDHGGGFLAIYNQTLLGNSAPDGGAIRSTTDLLLRNSLIGWSEGSPAVVSSRAPIEDWNAFWANAAGHLQVAGVAGALGSRDPLDDPRLELFEPGSGCDAVADYHSWYGPLRDGGDPLTTSDPDGSTADLGAWGGEHAPLAAWELDIDLDGYPPLYDCAEGDATIHPEAWDKEYDGIDADCDRGNDFDIDGDGFERDLDCNDHDPDVFPGASERPDGGDQNCDGRIDVDGDGYSPPEDCNDLNVRIHPGAVEDPDPKVDLDCTPPADQILPLVPRPCAVAPGPGGGGLLVVWLAAALRGRNKSGRRSSCVAVGRRPRSYTRMYARTNQPTSIESSG